MNASFGITKTEYLDLPFCGEENNGALDKICAVLLALTPILQHYKGIYQNAGFTVLLVLLPYVIIKLLRSRVNENMMAVLMPVLLFQIYKMADHSFSMSKALYAVCIIAYMLAFACGCINLKCVIKSAIAVSCCASVLILIQYICFYLGEYHLRLVPISLLLKKSSVWIAGAKTGLIGVTGEANGFYRPSAFFLEPSHMMLYCFPTMYLLLLSPQTNKQRILLAGLVTLGIVLSTSGMGMAIVFGGWFVYFVLYRDGRNNENVAKLNNLLKWQNAVLLGIMLIVLVIMYFKVDFVSNAVNRIFSSSSGSSAIAGRVGRAKVLVGDMNGSKLLFGVSEDVSKIDFNLSGFHSTLYKYGIIGLILSYAFYYLGFFKLRGSYFWINLIVIGISYFTAHTHGTFYMLYFAAILFNGFYSEVYHPQPRSEIISKLLVKKEN